MEDEREVDRVLREMRAEAETILRQGARTGDVDPGVVQRASTPSGTSVAEFDRGVDDLRAQMRTMSDEELVVQAHVLRPLLQHEHPKVAANAHFYFEFLVEEVNRRRGVAYDEAPSKEPSPGQLEVVRAVSELVSVGKEPTPRQVAKLTGRTRVQVERLIESCIADGLLARGPR